ncbi:hypothetical protein NDU88_003992 [Pleurodeles waltl]|uniref:Uncharacterized protein n=1 Tax=Pleurodeles waltl TaxID=8319 RepID=A0AAV7UEE9_PLEWA|nr:hypothetical protein NDU88_003992 [Pleurodeles waltl]
MALDSSDWRCWRALEESVCRSHGSQGADPCDMHPDFRVPETVKVDDGLRDGEEESIEDATEDAKEGEEEPDVGRRRREGRAGNSDVPTERTGRVRKDSSEETRTHHHVPGGAWLNKDIANAFGRFYQTLYTPEAVEDHKKLSAFPVKALLEGEISKMEVEQVIAKLPYHKAPGDDGFSAEFYKWTGAETVGWSGDSVFLV